MGSLVKEISEAEYSDVIENCAWSTFFNTTSWLKVLKESFGYDYTLLKFVAGGKEIVIPIVRTKKRYLMFNEYVSVPFEDYGGFFSKEDICREDVEIFIEGLKKEKTLAHLTIVPNPAVADIYPEECRGGKKFTHIIDTSSGYDHVFNEVYLYVCRKNVRKAGRNGIRVIMGKSMDDYMTHCRIYEDTAARWGRAPVYDRSFFENIQRLAGKYSRLYLAEFKGKIIAGLLNFVYNRYVYKFSSCYLNEFGGLAPVNFLHDFSIREACDENIKSCDFGGSTSEGKVLDSVIRFKETFGARRVDFNKIVITGESFSKLKKIKGAVKSD